MSSALHDASKVVCFGIVSSIYVKLAHEDLSSSKISQIMIELRGYNLPAHFGLEKVLLVI